MSSESDLARGWLIKAASDLGVTRLVVDSDGPYDTACFHAQQAIEKSLKGFLAFHRQPIPRTHDLEELQQVCLTLASLPPEYRPLLPGHEPQAAGGGTAAEVTEL